LLADKALMESVTWTMTNAVLWRVAGVTAAACRDRGPDEAGPSSIFIHGAELEKAVQHIYA